MFPHAELVPAACGPDEVAALRSSVTNYQRYGLVDRGSYEVGEVTASSAFDRTILRMLDLASQRFGRMLVARETRVLRLRGGDYLLARHDRPHEGRPVELVLDLSPTPVRAEIQYRRLGQVFFRVPCSPRSLAIVERTPAITCNHTYVSKLMLGVEVVRLIVLAR